MGSQPLRCFTVTLLATALLYACSAGKDEGDSAAGGGGGTADTGGDAGGGGDASGAKGGGAGGGLGGTAGGTTVVGGKGGGTGGAASSATGGVAGSSSGGSGTGGSGTGGSSTGGSNTGGSVGSGPRGTRVAPANFLEVKGVDLKDPKAVILTFDDGPDGTRNTDKILDVLKAQNIKATFCINTINAWYVPGVAEAQGVIKRMVAEGHALCNHSVHHKDLTTLPAAEAESEMKDVETTLLDFLPQAVPITLTRAPFMTVNPAVQKLLSRYGVHVQVDISSQDFACGNPQCVLTNVMNEVNAGKGGFILMHAFSPNTAAALPDLITQLRAKGMTFKTTEDVVKAKYGKTSSQLYGLP